MSESWCCRQQFVSLGILTLPCVYVLTSLLYVKGHVSQYMRHDQVQDYPTRGKGNLVPDFHRLSRARNGSNYLGIKFFNPFAAGVGQSREEKDCLQCGKRLYPPTLICGLLRETTKVTVLYRQPDLHTSVLCVHIHIFLSRPKSPPAV